LKKRKRRKEILKRRRRRRSDKKEIKSKATGSSRQTGKTSLASSSCTEEE